VRIQEKNLNKLFFTCFEKFNKELDYVSLGRDVESQVLARAIHAHVHHRVFVNGNKTVVFPASPGSYSSERMG